MPPPACSLTKAGEHNHADAFGHAGTTHSHAGAHNHVPAVSHANERRIFWAMLLTSGVMIMEIIGGWLSGSLALIADAGHMATDTAALVLAWLAFRLSRRPADAGRSYGFHRAEVLAAFVNALTMIALAGWIVFEAINRLLEPVAILGWPMLLVAIGGLIANILAFRLLHSGHSDNLNLQGAALHVMGDMLASVAAILAAIIIMGTGWTPADPLLSMLVAGLIMRSAWKLCKQSAHILMEGTPAHLDSEEICTDLRTHVEGVEKIHHIHAWSLTRERTVVTLHARIHARADHNKTLYALTQRLHDRFAIFHATIQIEQEPPPDSTGSDARDTDAIDAEAGTC